MIPFNKQRAIRIANDDRTRRWPAVAYWAASLAGVGVLLALVAAHDQPPAPKPASVVATQFSAARAWPVLAYLADSIGYRLTGTPGANSAASYLETTLRAIPGLEVERAETTGELALGARVTLYTVTNILVRIPGASPDAVLVSAHYDSPFGSVGAADDGVAVASLVEMARALAASPRLPHTVILNVNDGEELGLLGSHAFTTHPWMAAVRAFVNLESAGTAGKSILFQAGPGNAWLTQAYARSVPYPYGSVVGQDIFQSGAIPSDTDFRIYRDFGGLRGLDIAMYEGGYAYHTQRDRVWNVTPGSVQQTGENALALTRALAADSLRGNTGGAASVYYDVMGAHMFAYTHATASMLALIAQVLAVISIVIAARGAGVGPGRVVAALLTTVVAVIAGLSAALAAAVIPPYVLGRSMGWYARPGPGIVAFAAITLSAMLGVHRLVASRRARRKPDPAQVATAMWLGAYVLWAVMLAALTYAGMGSAYLALWWTLAGAVGLLIAAAARGARWWAGLLVAVVPGLLITLQVAMLLLMLFVPVMGRLPLPVAPDLVIALLVALPTALCAMIPLAGVQRVRRIGAAAVVALVVGLAALGWMAAQFPYTPLRPQRLTLVHQARDGADSLFVSGIDWNTPARAVSGLPALHPVGTGRPATFARAASPNGFADPALELVAERRDPSGNRVLDLRATSRGAPAMILRLPAAQVAAWSLATRPRPSAGGQLVVTMIAPPDSGVRFTITERGAEPLSLDLAAVRQATTPASDIVFRQLPEWTDVTRQAVNRKRFTF